MIINVLSVDKDESLIKQYDKVLKRISKNNKISHKVDSEYDFTYTVIEIDTLDILPKLEKKLFKINPQVQGLIFYTNGYGDYCIEIYDGYRE